MVFVSKYCVSKFLPTDETLPFPAVSRRIKFLITFYLGLKSINSRDYLLVYYQRRVICRTSGAGWIIITIVCSHLSALRIYKLWIRKKQLIRIRVETADRSAMRNINKTWIIRVNSINLVQASRLDVFLKNPLKPSDFTIDC